MNEIWVGITSICLLTVSTVIFGQSEPKTPVLKLVRSGGAYLAACETMTIFRSSSCSYALKKSTPSLEDALVNEVIPALPPEYQHKARTTMEKMKPELLRQQKQIVDGMIAATKKDYDPKTACGIAVGIITDTYSRAYDNWLEQKRMYASAVRPDEIQRIGYCVGVFAYAMNAFAYANQAGGVKVMSLQYGMAYATFGAISLANGERSLARVQAINDEIYTYAQTAKQYLDKQPSKVVIEANSCSDTVSPIFNRLSNAGVKIDENYSESLVDFSATAAASVRKDLGFQ